MAKCNVGFFFAHVTVYSRSGSFSGQLSSQWCFRHLSCFLSVVLPSWSSYVPHHRQWKEKRDSERERRGREIDRQIWKRGWQRQRWERERLKQREREKMRDCVRTFCTIRFRSDTRLSTLFLLIFLSPELVTWAYLCVQKENANNLMHTKYCSCHSI